MSQTFYAALVLAGGASYGIISTLVKLSYRSGFSINDVSSIQYFLGFFLLWTIWLLRVRKFPAKKTALAFLLTGIPLSGTTMLYNHALETLPASLAVIFLFQSIWLGTLAECVIRREKPTRIRLLSIAIVLAGTVLGAGVVGSAAAFPLSIGMLWGFAAAISYTTGLLCMNRIGRGIHPITKSALMVSGALVMVLLFLPPDLPVPPAHFASILPTEFLSPSSVSSSRRSSLAAGCRTSPPASAVFSLPASSPPPSSSPSCFLANRSPSRRSSASS